MLKSHWELILTEPVAEVVEFRFADWASSSSRVTLSLSYTKLAILNFIDGSSCLASVNNGKVVVESFRKKNILNKAEEIASLNVMARKQYSSINFFDGFIESIS